MLKISSFLLMMRECRICLLLMVASGLFMKRRRIKATYLEEEKKHFFSRSEYNMGFLLVALSLAVGKVKHSGAISPQLIQPS